MAKERRVEVMWMDYAREWAHDLDGLLKSWRTAALVIDKRLPIESEFPFTNPSSVDEANEWRDVVIGYMQGSSRILSELKMKYQNKRMSLKDDLIKGEAIAATEYWTRVIRGLNEYIKRENIKRGTIYKELDALEKAFVIAFKLLHKHKGTITEAPEDALIYKALLKFYLSQEAKKKQNRESKSDSKSE